MPIFTEQLTKEDVASYLTLPDERLILAIRRHSMFAAIPLFGTSFVWLILNMALYTLYGVLRFPVELYTLIVLFSIIFATMWALKTIIDWHCHIYVITNYKILEIQSSPMFCHSTHDVLLNQVRITEINVFVQNFIEGICDIGTISVEFDRFAHTEVFLMKGIRSAQAVGNRISDSLEGVVIPSRGLVPAKRLKLATDLFV